MAVDPNTNLQPSSIHLTEEDLELARDRMDAHTLALANSRRLPPIDGLSRMLGEGPTVLAGWTRIGPQAEARLARLGELGEEIQEYGGRLIVVTPDSVLPSTNIPVVVDTDRILSRDFGLWRNYYYIVVDGSSRVRYWHNKEASLTRQILALQRQSYVVAIDN